MRSDKHHKKNKESSSLHKFTKVWSILYLLVTIAFAGILVYMDLLPFKYLCMAIGIIAVLLLIIFPAMFFRNFKKSRKIISLVLSILLMLAYGAGIVYMSGTIDFFSKITKIGVQMEEYYVVARKDSDYKDENSIKGKTVQTYLSNELNYSEAKNKLKEVVDVKYEMTESLSELADGLIDQSYDTIFVSEAHYTTICSEKKNFRSDTKIIYTVEVEKETKDIVKDVNVTEEPFNVYISGLDTEGSISTVSRSDVNMIVTVNPKTHKVLLTSIPRDYEIKLPSKQNVLDKLTHTGLYGIEETIASVEQLMGIDINYYVKVNYTTVTKMVDAIGGIDINSDYAFTTHGMGVYYAFNEGENHLDGSMALAFARERKSFSDGDFQRNKNQQIVLEGVLKKALSSTTILTKYTSLLNAVEDNVEINMSQKDMQKLIKMQMDGMPSWNIQKQSITGTPDSKICFSTGDYYVAVVDVDQKSVISAVDKIVAVMEGEKK
ncbi:MAG: LCP family protein [Emergencia timonensis]|uniref:Cell envelope-related transcriptional attenuator domain-containing protein n=1 Tax=Emergencia timonensis TaxID=1776384 RepID=A0A415DSV1_9FIRM|nr:LCP family protein [Emergencia timonensis]MBS6178977.1 LCP family protein [Clostridiales bacterium]MCB6478346.1 LCP family protein [Emergencia timonensis]RHJ82870.1 hypothetical protein DW099_19490 [Emergencia timonensis]WNX88563.1 LCP family protein [Emergencia timonensis]BDF10378.1 LytR family transcriptional regulator [Emergencia timonensis]